MKSWTRVIICIVAGGVLSLVCSDWMFLVVGISLSVFMALCGGDEERGRDRTEKRLQERIDTRK